MLITFPLLFLTKDPYKRDGRRKLFQDTIFDTSTQLTAPGNGSEVQVAVNNYFATSSYTLFVKVAAINTNVKVALQGSLNNSDWADIIADQTISANGNYFYSVTGRPVKYIRPVFVSEAGGTAATVDFVVAAL